MKLFEIPFKRDSDHGWTIPIPGDGERQFQSREAALAFARLLADEAKSSAGEVSYLCVEGGDGKWRLFTPELKPVS